MAERVTRHSSQQTNMASLQNNPFKRFKKAHKMEGKMDGQAVHALMKRKPAHWIQGAIKKPGALHKELGIKMGNKIPEKTFAHAAHEGGKLGRRARLAETLKGMHKTKKKASSKYPTPGMQEGDIEKKASKRMKHMKRKGTIGMEGDVEMKKSEKKYKRFKKAEKSSMCMKCKAAHEKHTEHEGKE